MMRFWDGKKSAKNRKNEQRWRPKATHRATFGWPGGMRGATGEGTMGRGQRSLHEFCMQCEAEFCRMLTCVRHALPWLEARGGGIAYAHSAGPNLWFAVVLRGRAVRCQTKLHVVLRGCGVVGLLCVCVFYWPRGSQKASKICFVRQLLPKPNENGTNIDHKWDQSGPGGGEGATENRQKYEKVPKTQT